MPSKPRSTEPTRSFDAHLAEAATMQTELMAAESEAASHVSSGRIVPAQAIVYNAMNAAGNTNTAAQAGRPGAFSNMFPQARASRAASSLPGDFAKAVYERNPRLFNAASGMGEGVGADGGFFVPLQFYAGLMDGTPAARRSARRDRHPDESSADLEIPMFDPEQPLDRHRHDGGQGHRPRAPPARPRRPRSARSR